MYSLSSIVKLIKMTAIIHKLGRQFSWYYRILTEKPSQDLSKCSEISHVCVDAAWMVYSPSSCIDKFLYFPHINISCLFESSSFFQQVITLPTLVYVLRWCCILRFDAMYSIKGYFCLVKILTLMWKLQSNGTGLPFVIFIYSLFSHWLWSSVTYN